MPIPRRSYRQQNYPSMKKISKTIKPYGGGVLEIKNKED
jgi:hypothetical protein